MDHYLFFHVINYDTQRIYKQDIQFFQDEKPLFPSRSVTHMNEAELVRWLIHKKDAFKLLLKLLNLPINTEYFLEVRKPITDQENEGDIDLILLPNNDPYRAIAVECKRAKVEILDNNGKEKVNKINDIRKGFKQSKRLREMGFYKTYLLVFVVTDGRNKITPNTFFRDGESAQVKELYRMSMEEPLHSDVGFIYVKITQPTDKDINWRGNIGICHDKEAVPIEPSKNLVERLRLLAYYRFNAIKPIR